MWFQLISTVVGMSLGFLLGAVVVWRLLRSEKKRRRRTRPFDRRSSSYEPGDYIDQAAERWAKSQGQPAAAPLVARKLRLLQSISERRSRGWWQ